MHPFVMDPLVRRRRFAAPALLCLAAMITASWLTGAAATAETLERFVAIDNYCAWPNLTVLDDGTLIATIFNKPSHGKHEGDVECWASTDGGRLWKLRGVAAPHEAGTTRMNVAAGLAHDGSLVVIASGWGGKGLRERVLRPWICRSTDGGRTWARSGQIQFPAGVETMIPFGDVIQGRGKTLAAALYGWAVDPETGKPLRGRHSYMLFSKDDGRSWGDAVMLGPDDYNETSLLAFDPGRWLAAVRTYKAGNLELFSSADQGRTWKHGGPLTMPSHHPAHLLRMNDGRVLLTYGIREKNHQGIGRRISDDGGRTWGAPTRIVDLDGSTDGGYPATVQLKDGTLVTAYYSNGIPQHRRYHMGVVRWRLEE